MKILSPATSLGRIAEEKRAWRYQWLHVYGEDRGCNSGRYWSAWSNQQHPISVDIENQPLGRTRLQVLVEQIPAGVQARLRLKTTSFVSTLPRPWHGLHDLCSAFLTATTASGRSRPSDLGMYPRRPGSARYAPRWSRACRSSSLCSRSASYSPHLSPSTPGAAFSLSSKNAFRSRGTVIWWKSAVNFSFFLCLATCRMRSSACDTLSRSCARYVLC